MVLSTVRGRIRYPILVHIYCYSGTKHSFCEYKEQDIDMVNAFHVFIANFRKESAVPQPYRPTIWLLIVFLGLFIILTSQMFLFVPDLKAQSTEPSLLTTFVFAAGGDIGANPRSDASLRAIPALGASFFLALGDLDYDQISSDAAWCDYVKTRVGNTFPFELVTGNHEEGSLNRPGPDGYVR